MSSITSFNSTNVRNALALAWLRIELSAKSALAPHKAVDKAARLFTTPPRFEHTPPERALLAAGIRHDLRNSEQRIATWRFGPADRAAVVLCHGWGGRGAQLRAFVPALLDAGYQAIIFDHVGHGASEGREATLVRFVRGLDAVIHDVRLRGVAVAAIIGHSLGAAAATAWMNDTGDQLRAVLIAPPTSLERYSGFFARKLGIAESVRSQMQERLERRLGRRWSEFELPQSVANVRGEALVIHDDGDRDVAPAWRRRFHRRARGVRSTPGARRPAGLLCTRTHRLKKGEAA